MNQELDKNIIKAAIREAATDWLDQRFKMVGKWTLAGLGAALFTVFVKLMVGGEHWPK